jgi:hypothetical protein
VFNNQIVVALGGSSFAVADLWTSPATGSNPGFVWTQVTADTGIPARFGATGGVHNGVAYIVGGIGFNDIFYSLDLSRWIAIPSAEFSVSVLIRVLTSPSTFISCVF